MYKALESKGLSPKWLAWCSIIFELSFPHNGPECKYIPNPATLYFFPTMQNNPPRTCLRCIEPPYRILPSINIALLHYINAPGNLSWVQFHLVEVKFFGGGGRKRLPKFKFLAKFPIGLHVILQIQIKKIRKWLLYYVKNYFKQKSVEVQPCTPLEIMSNGFCLKIIR